MSKPAAIKRLLKWAPDYKMKLTKNERVRPGNLEISMNPADYEKDGGDSLQVEVFDKLSKTYLVVDSTGNVSGFIEMWKKKGLKAAVEGLKQKYRLPVTPVTEEKKLLQKIDRDVEKIQEGVARLLNHFAIEDPKRPPVASPKPGVVRTEEKTEGGEGSKANGKSNGKGKGNGDGNGGNGNGGNGDVNSHINVPDDSWWGM